MMMNARTIRRKTPIAAAGLAALLILAVNAAPSAAARSAGASARQKFNRANRLLYSGKVEEARQGFMAILTEHKDDPVIPKVYLGLGEVYRRQGLADFAIRMYTTVLEQYPESPEKKIVQDRLVNLLFTERRFPEAERLILELLEERPGEKHLARRLAAVLEKQGDKAGAIDVYEKIYRSTRDGWVRDKLFALYDETGMTDDKIEQLQQEAAAQPAAMQPRLFLAQLYKYRKDYERAGEVLAELVRSQPNNASLRYQLGQTYLAAGDERAIGEFQKARALNPSNTRFAVALGNAYFNDGDAKRAVQAWRFLIDNNPGKKRAYRNYANVLSGHGLLNEAVDAYREARKHFKDSILFYNEIAELFAVEGRFTDAVDEYLRVLRLRTGTLSRVKKHVLKLAAATPAAVPVISTRLEKLLEPAPEKYPGVCEILALLKITSGQPEAGAKLLAVASVQKDDQGHLFIEVARSEIREGRLRSALIVLDHGTRTYTDGEEVPELLFQKAQLLATLGEYDRAAKLFGRLRTSFSDWPGLPRVLEQLGRIYLEETGEWERAEAVWRQMLDGYPSPWKDKAAVRLAESSFRRGRFEDAMQRLVPLAGGGGYGAERAAFLVGMIHLNLYRLDQARDAFIELQVAHPDSELVNDALQWQHLLALGAPEERIRQFIHAHFLLWSARYEEALDETEKLVEDGALPPSLAAKTHLLKGRLLEKSGAPEQAVALYGNLADRYPGTADAQRALYRAATLLVNRLQRPEDGRNLYKKLVIEYPKELLPSMVRSLYGEEMLR